jgi:succinate dehydrogenase / fumarate reductase membrane anchor subunit
MSTPAAWELAPRAIRDEEASSRVFGYVALRVTGLMLSVLVLGHFAVTHFVTDVAHDNAAFVARRLSSAVWIVWDGTMLAAALAHGAFGVRLAIADYATDARARRLWGRTVGLVVVVLFVLGLIVIARAANA